MLTAAAMAAFFPFRAWFRRIFLIGLSLRLPPAFLGMGMLMLMRTLPGMPASALAKHNGPHQDQQSNESDGSQDHQDVPRGRIHLLPLRGQDFNGSGLLGKKRSY